MTTGNQTAILESTRGIAAAILAFSNFMVVLDLTVANVSIPHIAGSIGVSPDQGTWVITSYAVAEAIAVPLTGWLANRFGAVSVYLACMTGFGFCSLLCGLSVSLEMMVACRVGQGLCGGLLMPLAQTILLRIFPPEQRNKAMLLWAITTMMGPALGPNIGGLISDNLNWRWIFLINIPIAIGCITAGSIFLRPVETPRRKGPIDVVGLGLLVFWVSCLQIMLDTGREHDWFEDPSIVALAIMALLGFAVFVIWELTDEHPIVDIRVFRHRGFTFSVMALALCFGAYFAGIVVIPQWLQTSLGYPAAKAGFVTACTAIAALTTSQLAARSMRFVDPRLMVCGAVSWLGCMAIMRSHWVSESDFWTLAMPQLIQGLGMSFFMLPLTTLSISAVLPEEIPSAAGLQNFVRTLAIGVFTAGTLTIWSNTGQAAHNELASRLQPGPTMRALSQAGLSREAGTALVASLVDRESVTMAVDYVFQLTAVVFFFSAAVIWLAPRPKSAPTAPGR